MKTRVELNAIKEEVEVLNKKLAELTEEELKQVAGGVESRDSPHGMHGHVEADYRPLVNDHHGADIRVG